MFGMRRTIRRFFGRLSQGTGPIWAMYGFWWIMCKSVVTLPPWAVSLRSSLSNGIRCMNKVVSLPTLVSIFLVIYFASNNIELCSVQCCLVG